MNYITVDGVQSLTKLRFDKLPLFPMAVQEVETYDVGRDQTVAYPLESYKDISLTLTAYLVGQTEIQDIYQWLNGAKTLTLSTQPDIYACIKSIGDIQPDREGWKAHKITIPLTLSPFKYAISNDEAELTNGGYYYNKGSIYSRPVWTLHNVQTLVLLTVNGKTFSVDVQDGETVVIDTERYLVYSGDTVLLDKTVGDLPLLNAGMNQITWAGTVEKVTVRPNARWL